MGRRPNPLVVEFFERGAKLEDKTNRYEHRCKKCGELFPKGRSDSLTSHLLRKCPNVTQEDRQWVFDQIQQTPDKTNVVSSRPPSSTLPSLGVESTHTDAPSQSFQEHSALATLAEVSRHHLDYSSHRGFAEVFQDQRGEQFSEQAFIDQLRQSAGIGNPVTTAESENIYLYTADPEPHTTPRAAEVPLISTATLAPSPLVQTASAANQQLEQADTQGIELSQTGSLVDPQLDDMGAPPQTDESNHHSNLEQDTPTMDWNATSFGQSTFGALSMPPNSSETGFGMLQKGSKQKTRSHFNDTRRKEVQEIRKRGACLRCRMLKKPCSGETPCSTCRSVESARLWKGQCLRTRVADEFGLWSTSLFHSRAKIEIPAAIHGLEHRSVPGRIEARFFAASSLCMSFAVKACMGGSTGELPSDEMVPTQTIWLLDDRDSISDKLESYVLRTTEALTSDDRSSFMRATLVRALALVNAEDSEQATRVFDAGDQKSSRSCYSLQNQLLKNVIELWVHTRLLTSSRMSTLQLRYNEKQAPRHLPEEMEWTQEGDKESHGSILRSSQNYSLIKSQLMAAIEARCSKLSKTVMNELERRLLQRQQVSRFATFLSAVILLNSVELMTGLYSSFDASSDDPRNFLSGKENKSSPGQSAKNSSISSTWGGISFNPASNFTSWPLASPPSSLWPQGPHFADLLTMLLRMRALPPKTCQTSDGTLAALQDYSLPVHVNGRPAREQIDEQTKFAAEWLDPLQLNVNELVQKRDGPLPASGEGAEEWEMRFVSKVLLNERIR